MYKIIIYKNKNGKELIKDYFAELALKASTNKNYRIKQKKIFEYLDILKTYGTRAGEPYVKHIVDDIWEIRPTDDRMLFAYFKDNIFVLLHHFKKTTNKTPEKEKNKAKENLKDFLQRN